MGLFDSILNGAKKIMDGSKKSVENIQRNTDQDSNHTVSTGNDRFDAPSEPLPAVPVQTRLHENNVQFMISDDFTEHDGYMSSTVSLKYNPEHLGVLEYDDEDEITVSLHEGVVDFDEIASCIEEYLSSGTVSDVEEFEDYPDGKYMFRAKVYASDYIMYFYVLRSDASDPYDYDILLLFYSDYVQKTNLEKKLVSCFDEAAKTLTIFA